MTRLPAAAPSGAAASFSMQNRNFNLEQTAERDATRLRRIGGVMFAYRLTHRGARLIAAKLQDGGSRVVIDAAARIVHVQGGAK